MYTWFNKYGNEIYYLLRLAIKRKSHAYLSASTIRLQVEGCVLPESSYHRVSVFNKEPILLSYAESLSKNL